MHFGKGNPEHKYKIEPTELMKVTEEKYVVVHITSEAKPSLQCRSSKKATNYDSQKRRDNDGHTSY